MKWLQAAELDVSLNDPATYRDVPKAKRLAEDREPVGEELAALEEEWLRRQG